MMNTRGQDGAAKSVQSNGEILTIGNKERHGSMLFSDCNKFIIRSHYIMAIEELLVWARENGVEEEIQKVLDGDKRLNLSNKKLKTLPADLSQLTHLQELYLSYNQLSSLPISHYQQAWRGHLLKEMSIDDLGQDTKDLEQMYEKPMIKTIA